MPINNSNKRWSWSWDCWEAKLSTVMYNMCSTKIQIFSLRYIAYVIRRYGWLWLVVTAISISVISKNDMLIGTANIQRQTVFIFNVIGVFGVIVRVINVNVIFYHFYFSTNAPRTHDILLHYSTVQWNGKTNETPSVVLKMDNATALNSIWVKVSVVVDLLVAVRQLDMISRECWQFRTPITSNSETRDTGDKFPLRPPRRPVPCQNVISLLKY